MKDGVDESLSYTKDWVVGLRKGDDVAVVRGDGDDIRIWIDEYVGIEDGFMEVLDATSKRFQFRLEDGLGRDGILRVVELTDDLREWVKRQMLIRRLLAVDWDCYETEFLDVLIVQLSTVKKSRES